MKTVFAILILLVGWYPLIFGAVDLSLWFFGHPGVIEWGLERFWFAMLWFCTAGVASVVVTGAMQE